MFTQINYGVLKKCLHKLINVYNDYYSADFERFLTQFRNWRGVHTTVSFQNYSSKAESISMYLNSFTFSIAKFLYSSMSIIVIFLNKGPFDNLVTGDFFSFFLFLIR